MQHINVLMESKANSVKLEIKHNRTEDRNIDGFIMEL